MRLSLILCLVGAACAVSINKDDNKWAASDKANGDPNWLNRNDIDWETCHLNQVVGQSGILNLALEDEDEGNTFTDHHAFLYRCNTGPNPFYLRYTKQTGGSVLIKIQWPTILDENYLFATKAEDRDHIGYGFRIAVASSTKTRWHYRKFFFHTLRSLNRFVAATSTLMNNQKNVMHKADFFKSPRLDIPNIEVAHGGEVNAYGDHFFGTADTELLKAADQGQPEVPRDDALEDGHYVRNTVEQISQN